MIKTEFVEVIFTDEEWKWLERHMASLQENEMVLNVLSALDDGVVYEDKKEE